MWWKRIVSLAAVGLAMGVTVAADSGDVKVVVNGKNSMTSIDAGHLSKIFLKETMVWPDGSETVPVDMAPESGVRKRFSKRVHERKVAAIKSYWQRQIFSGKAIPPVEFTSEEDLLFFVAATPGAVGYVSNSTPLTEGVRELRIEGLK